jgi:hypothetical protein
MVASAVFLPGLAFALRVAEKTFFYFSAFQLIYGSAQDLAACKA